VLNFLLPLEGVLPMHCSANVGPEGDTALFFGLSGTGKTTLSADPSRSLIGDDEHGWSENGIFNFEDGCYAKVIRLSPEAEPQIHACTRRFGTILENVVVDPLSRRLDLNDDLLTENTRGAYPLDYIENYLPPKMAGHPRNVVFPDLRCQRCHAAHLAPHSRPGHLPLHFRLHQQDRGHRDRPGQGARNHFQHLFWRPFMVHRPYAYAEMLKARLLKYGAVCWLVNTGWTGGSFGLGKRHQHPAHPARF